LCIQLTIKQTNWEEKPMTHTRKKQKSTKKQMRMLAILLVPVVALILGAAAPELWAGNYDDDDEIPFDVAELFFELNDTDGDLGIHALVDGDAWKYLEIEDPRDRKMLNIIVRGRLRRQGLTELFFESAEPSFDELLPQKFFRRFPEGEYDIEGITLEGEERESEVWLSHVLPAPPAPTVNGNMMAVQCDDEEPDYDATVVNAPVTIEWPAVTESHPDLGKEGEVVIHNYEVVVEKELVVNGEEFTSKFSVILPPDQTSMTIPSEFINEGDEFKYEVLAREESYNQTAVESCFVIVD
jgi:hypothetical protein